MERKSKENTNRWNGNWVAPNNFQKLDIDPLTICSQNFLTPVKENNVWNEYH